MRLFYSQPPRQFENYAAVHRGKAVDEGFAEHHVTHADWHISARILSDKNERDACMHVADHIKLHLIHRRVII